MPSFTVGSKSKCTEINCLTPAQYSKGGQRGKCIKHGGKAKCTQPGCRAAEQYHKGGIRHRCYRHGGKPKYILGGVRHLPVVLAHELAHELSDEQHFTTMLLLATDVKPFIPAQYQLANMYFSGRGVKKDEVEGLKWANEARKGKHAMAILRYREEKTEKFQNFLKLLEGSDENYIKQKLVDWCTEKHFIPVLKDLRFLYPGRTDKQLDKREELVDSIKSSIFRQLGSENEDQLFEWSIQYNYVPCQMDLNLLYSNSPECNDRFYKLVRRINGHRNKLRTADVFQKLESLERLELNKF
jgi:hypothetical protein